jgi:hypothetical protein
VHRSRLGLPSRLQACVIISSHLMIPGRPLPPGTGGPPATATASPARVIRRPPKPPPPHPTHALALLLGHPTGRQIGTASSPAPIRSSPYPRSRCRRFFQEFKMHMHGHANCGQLKLGPVWHYSFSFVANPGRFSGRCLSC